jgi:hypothetical protein
MTLSAEEFKDRSRHPHWERELAQKLRQIPEQERLKFLLEFLSVNQVVVLDLARRCLSERKSFETLLENGLHTELPGTLSIRAIKGATGSASNPCPGRGLRHGFEAEPVAPKASLPGDSV